MKKYILSIMTIISSVIIFCSNTAFANIAPIYDGTMKNFIYRYNDIMWNRFNGYCLIYQQPSPYQSDAHFDSYITFSEHDNDKITVAFFCNKNGSLAKTLIFFGPKHNADSYDSNEVALAMQEYNANVKTIECILLTLDVSTFDATRFALNPVQPYFEAEILNKNKNIVLEKNIDNEHNMIVYKITARSRN